VYLISGYLQNYAWGVTGGLEPWTDTGDGTAPEAELWFGCHANGPSPLVGQPGVAMADLVDPSDAPLLVKVLAAATPLSLQIHPPAEQAELVFAAQQRDPGMPKILADSLAKTEMLIALQPFSVLQGLREPHLAAAILDEVGGPCLEAAALVRGGDLKAAIRYLLAIPSEQIPGLVSAVPAAAARAGLDAAALEALALILAQYPSDSGVLIATLLDHRTLARGEAVYVPTGVVHAYIEGVGIEVMTNSDNVLRLGLTPKTVAVDAALEALDLALCPEPIGAATVGLSGGGSTRDYAPAGAPFAVRWLSDGSVSVGSGSYRLVLAVDGQAQVRCGEQSATLNQGQAAAVLADEPAVEVRTSGSVFIANSVSDDSPGPDKR